MLSSYHQHRSKDLSYYSYNKNNMYILRSLDNHRVFLTFHSIENMKNNKEQKTYEVLKKKETTKK